jgi:hypothetical protein
VRNHDSMCPPLNEVRWVGCKSDVNALIQHHGIIKAFHRLSGIRERSHLHIGKR